MVKFGLSALVWLALCASSGADLFGLSYKGDQQTCLEFDARAEWVDRIDATPGLQTLAKQNPRLALCLAYQLHKLEDQAEQDAALRERTVGTPSEAVLDLMALIEAAAREEQSQ